MPIYVSSIAMIFYKKWGSPKTQTTSGNAIIHPKNIQLYFCGDILFISVIIFVFLYLVYLHRCSTWDLQSFHLKKETNDTDWYKNKIKLEIFNVLADQINNQRNFSRGQKILKLVYCQGVKDTHVHARFFVLCMFVEQLLNTTFVFLIILWDFIIFSISNFYLMHLFWYALLYWKVT